MVPYLQLERLTGGIIAPNAAVIFDEILAENGPLVYSKTTGEITFNKTGTYFISWFVVQQTGLDPNGSNFAIVTSEPGPDIFGSNHIKMSSTSGFALIEVKAQGETVVLENKSSAGTSLSANTQVKAALAVFLIPDDRASGTELGYLQAQISNGPVILDDGEPIHFNHLISKDPYDIVDKGSHDEFILGAEGTYLVTWEIPLDSTEANPDATFTLKLDDVIISSSYTPLSSGALSGSAMVINNSDDGELKLVNTSDDKVKIDNLTNIVITQITNTSS